MESLSGDYDNAFTDTKGGLLSVCVSVCMGWGNLSFVGVCPLLEVKVIKVTGEILVID